MYRGVTSSKPAAKSAKKKQLVATKVNRVCEGLRTLMLTMDADKYMRSILTTYVCQDPPDLEAALLLIKKSEGDAKKLDSMLKYAAFLVDVNLLFDVALGLYDFELVLAVAQKSQKDPKEYLPFLSELQKLELNYRKFKIDDHLKRRGKALKNLAQAGEDRFDEALNYTVSHNLYREAIEAFTADARKTKMVMKAYGEYLESLEQFQEAGFAFSCCGEEREALRCYQRADAWRGVFSMAGLLHLKGNELTQLATAVATSLKDRGMYQDSATVSVTYAQDHEVAVETLVLGFLWDEALRVAHTLDRADLVETTIKPGVLAAHVSVTEEIQALKEQFQKEQARLEVVRADKTQRLEQMSEYLPLFESPLFLVCLFTHANILLVDQLGLTAGQFANENVDMFSDTTSMASTTARSFRTGSSAVSRSSKQSSRTKKRMERKKTRSKEGGMFEETYLMDSHTRAYQRGNELAAVVRGLLTNLLYFGHREAARGLQALYGELLSLLESRADIIFLTREEQLQRQGELLKLNPDAVLEKIYDRPTLTAAGWRHPLLG